MHSKDAVNDISESVLGVATVSLAHAGAITTAKRNHIFDWPRPPTTKKRKQDDDDKLDKEGDDIKWDCFINLLTHYRKH